MDPKVQFLFYLGAVICFALAAFGGGAGLGARGGRALMPAMVPLGLLLFVFPVLWNTGELAF